MKLGRSAKQSIVAFLFFLMMAAVYGALIAGCNQLLRHYGLLSQFSKRDAQNDERKVSPQRSTHNNVA